MALGVLACVATYVLAFVLGSVPFGVIIGKVFYHTDIRTVGSGNIGTTNAIRALGKKGGYAVFALDFLKGVAAGLVGAAVFALMGDKAAPLSYGTFVSAAFLGCTMGHIFSPWLGFKGGKGIAVAVGCLFVTFGPVGALLELALFGVLVAATKYVSVGSIAAAAACPFFALYYHAGDWPAIALCTAVGLLVVWAHRGNIARLRAGQERRIGQGKAQ